MEHLYVLAALKKKLLIGLTLVERELDKFVYQNERPSPCVTISYKTSQPGHCITIVVGTFSVSFYEEDFSTLPVLPDDLLELIKIIAAKLHQDMKSDDVMQLFFVESFEGERDQYLSDRKNNSVVPKQGSFLRKLWPLLP